jgi:hypothetical protein
VRNGSRDGSRASELYKSAKGSSHVFNADTPQTPDDDSSGRVNGGGAQTGAILLSIIKGGNLRLAATQGYDATLGILVPEKNPIRTPKDLEGKK